MTPCLAVILRYARSGLAVLAACCICQALYAAPTSQPTTDNVARQVQELRAEVAELRAEIRLLKLALAKLDRQTPDDPAVVFQQRMSEFVRVAFEIEQRLADGVNYEDYNRKVGELSDAFARLPTPAPPGDRSPDALITAKRVLDGYVRVRDNFLDTRDAERRLQAKKINRLEPGLEPTVIQIEKDEIASASRELAKIRRWLDSGEERKR